MNDELRDRLIASPTVKLANIGLGNLSDVSASRRAYYTLLASLDLRKQWTQRGFAMRDGSFPIPNVEYLRFALEAFNNAEDRRKAKRHIIRRARALNRIHLLPETWRGEETEGGSPRGRN